MKNQGLIYTITFLLLSLISQPLAAEESFLYGVISSQGENDELIKEANISISIESPADISSRDISTASGKFKLGLKRLKSGAAMILAVAKKTDKRHWAMLHPYEGKVRVPQQPANDIIKVVIVPADSHKRKSAAAMSAIIQLAAAKQSMQGLSRKPEQQQQSWKQQLATLAKQKGIPEQQFIDDIDAFVSDVLQQPNAYDQDTKAYADYANKNFQQAEKSFIELAEKQEKVALKENQKTSEFYKMAGLSADSRYQYQNAIKHFKQALRFSDKQKNASSWAELQGLLANAHRKFAVQTSGKAIAQHFAFASRAYQQALTVYTREQLPQGWATTQNNLAITLQQQGIRTGGKEGQRLLSEAVTAYRLALEVYTREQLPQQWAATQNNLANTLQQQGIRRGGKEGQRLLSEAVTAYRLALEVRTEKHLPANWKQSRNNLASALNALGYDLIENPQRLKEAREMLLEAVEINPKQPAYQDSLGWAEYRLGNLQEAEKHLQQAFAGFSHPEHASHLIEVLWKRDKHSEAKQLLAKMLKEHPKDAMLLAVKKRLKI